MHGPVEQNDTNIGRFDQSFLIAMIKDFFVILLIVTALEFVIKVGKVYYDFRVHGGEDVTVAADEIADNVRSIMLNEGGPVAARTLYPILQESWTARGYTIAIEPAEITREAIAEGFGYVPEGIPRGEWSDGAHRGASVEIKAQDFCLSCHTTASVGDVLGAVTVRSYLADDIAIWWQDIKLTAGLAVGKILLHSILLFILLRARMEPLLRLRVVVSKLARAYGGLDHRAEIRSTDEFGALAGDLNLFLDRISRIVEELDMVLRKVVSVNDDIITIQGDLRGQVDSVVTGARRLERRAMISARREPLLSNVWFDAVKGSIAELDGVLEKVEGAPQAGDLVDTLRAVVENAEAQIRTNEALFSELGALGEDTERFQAAVAEMARLEERMKAIIETGGLLVSRLRPEREEAVDAAIPLKTGP